MGLNPYDNRDGRFWQYLTREMVAWIVGLLIYASGVVLQSTPLIAIGLISIVIGYIAYETIPRLNTAETYLDAFLAVSRPIVVVLIIAPLHNPVLSEYTLEFLVAGSIWWFGSDLLLTYRGNRVPRPNRE